MWCFVLPIYWMPIHYDTIEDGKTKHPIVYSEAVELPMGWVFMILFIWWTCSPLYVVLIVTLYSAGGCESEGILFCSPNFIWQLIGIEEGYMSLMDENGETRDDLKVPENDLGKEINSAYEDEKDIMVSAWLIHL